MPPAAQQHISKSSNGIVGAPIVNGDETFWIQAHQQCAQGFPGEAGLANCGKQCIDAKTLRVRCQGVEYGNGDCAFNIPVLGIM